jgi:hypothetical protein
MTIMKSMRNDHVIGCPQAASIPELNLSWRVSRGDHVVAKHIEDVNQFLQSFGVAGLARLFLLVLIAALARNFTLALAASLLSLLRYAFYCPGFCNERPRYSEWARLFLGGVGKHRCACPMMALNKQIADLTSRMNQLESAEERRLALEVRRRGRRL